MRVQVTLALIGEMLLFFFCFSWTHCGSRSLCPLYRIVCGGNRLRKEKKKAVEQ